jgi:hypothetical protein
MLMFYVGIILLFWIFYAALIVIIVFLAIAIYFLAKDKHRISMRPLTATLTAQPCFICSTDTEVALQWDATGDTTTLSSSHTIREGLGSVGLSGHMMVHVIAAGITRITLESRRGSEAPARDSVNIQVLDMSVPITIGGQARCRDWQGISVMQTSVSYSATEWSSSIQVHQIEFALGTTDFCRVYHNNLLVLSETIRTADLGGVSIIGDWIFMREHNSSEPCDENSPLFHGWPSFSIIATITCS